MLKSVWEFAGWLGGEFLGEEISKAIIPEMRITVVCNLKYPTANYDSPVGCQQKALPQLKLSDCLPDLILNIKVIRQKKKNIIHIHIFGISVLLLADLQYVMFSHCSWRGWGVYRKHSV